MPTNIKPINVAHVPSVNPALVRYVLDGINAVLHIAGISRLVDVKNYGIWRQSSKWQDGSGKLVPYQSIDWYSKMARDCAIRDGWSGYHHADALIECFADHDPYRGLSFSVMITDSFLAGHDGTRGGLGVSEKGVVSIVTTAHLKSVSGDLSAQGECLKTLIMHEVGHLFGVTEHCADSTCIMQGARGDPVVEMTRLTYERLNGQAVFCAECRRDIISYFT